MHSQLSVQLPHRGFVFYGTPAARAPTSTSLPARPEQRAESLTTTLWAVKTHLEGEVWGWKLFCTNFRGLYMAAKCLYQL